jgi:hypothetical protein
VTALVECLSISKSQPPYLGLCHIHYIRGWLEWNPVPGHWMIDGDNCGAVSGINERQGKPEYSKNAYPSAGFSSTDAK